MSHHTDRELANLIAILALVGLLWLFFSWKAALATFLIIVLLTQATVLFKKQ